MNPGKNVKKSWKNPGILFYYFFTNPGYFSEISSLVISISDFTEFSCYFSEISCKDRGIVYMHLLSGYSV